MQTISSTLAVFIAQTGPLISRRLSQLPVVPTVGVIFNFDNEYYQETLPPIVCVGRTAGGKIRDVNSMLFEALSMIHSEAEVIDLFRRRIISYTVPETGGSQILQISNRIEEGCSDLLLVQCKRLRRQQQEGTLSVAQMLAAPTSDEVTAGSLVE